MAGGRPTTGKITISRRITPNLVPILDAFIKMLEENGGMVSFQPGNPYQPPKEVACEKPVERMGISVNDFLAKIGKPAIALKEPPEDKNIEQDEKDYTEWQNDDTMIEVDRAVSWGWASCGAEDSQLTPDEGFEILQKNSKLATQLVETKRNGKTAKYNELMTELYERIRK